MNDNASDQLAQRRNPTGVTSADAQINQIQTLILNTCALRTNTEVFPGEVKTSQLRRLARLVVYRHGGRVPRRRRAQGCAITDAHDAGATTGVSLPGRHRPARNKDRRSERQSQAIRKTSPAIVKTMAVHFVPLPDGRQAGTSPVRRRAKRKLF